MWKVATKAYLSLEDFPRFAGRRVVFFLRFAVNFLNPKTIPSLAIVFVISNKICKKIPYDYTSFLHQMKKGHNLPPAIFNCYFILPFSYVLQIKQYKFNNPLIKKANHLPMIRSYPIIFSSPVSKVLLERTHFYLRGNAHRTVQTL